LNWEAIMRFRITGILLLDAMALAAPAAAQTTPAPSAITRTVIAATKVPTVTDVPLHFRAVGGYSFAGREERRLGGQAIKAYRQRRWRSALAICTIVVLLIAVVLVSVVLR
jgi:hypothetical protein